MLLMSRSRAPYHHGGLADALEDAAMVLLADRPATAISLREVARAADVSHNAPYHHFRDRVGLLKSLAERSMVMLVEAVDDAAGAAGSPADALLDAGATYVRFAAAHVHEFDVIYDPSICVPGSPTERMAPLIARLEEILVELCIEVGMPDAADADAVWGLMHGLATLVGAGHLSVDAGVAAYRVALTRMITP